MIQIFLILYFLLCIGGLYKKRSLPIYIGLVTVCIVITGFNINNPDYTNYANRYNWAEYPQEINLFSILDISYLLLQAFCKDIGITTYEDFRIFLSILIFGIFALVIYKYCIYYNLFFIIYTFVYLPIDLIQLRNFLAFIVLLPFLLLLNKPSVKNCIKYLMGVLLSFSIHFSSIIFGIFGFIGVKSKTTKIVFIIIAMFAVLILYPTISTVSGNAAATEHVSSYSKPSVLGGVFMSSFLVINYFVMVYAFRKNNIILSQSNSAKLFITKTFIQKVNFLLLFLIPLVFMNGTALRVFRFISMVNIIYIINFIYYSRNQKNRLSLYYFILVLYAFFFGFYFAYTDADVMYSVLNNSLLK